MTLGLALTFGARIAVAQPVSEVSEAMLEFELVSDPGASPEAVAQAGENGMALLLKAGTRKEQGLVDAVKASGASSAPAAEAAAAESPRVWRGVRQEPLSPYTPGDRLAQAGAKAQGLASGLWRSAKRDVRKFHKDPDAYGKTLGQAGSIVGWFAGVLAAVPMILSAAAAPTLGAVAAIVFLHVGAQVVGETLGRGLGGLLGRGIDAARAAIARK
ncbi:MAG: hypothetical protein HY554_14065 [Elusimicrobia bacterium]|nr:hypothetical protein [Elusimicrobiota bacterium]